MSEKSTATDPEAAKAEIFAYGPQARRVGGWRGGS